MRFTIIWTRSPQQIEALRLALTSVSILGDRCIGPGCSVMFRDKTMSVSTSARNILLSQFGWLLNSLQSGGVNVASNLNEAKLCYKCFKNTKGGLEIIPLIHMTTKYLTTL